MFSSKLLDGFTVIFYFDHLHVIIIFCISWTQYIIFFNYHNNKSLTSLGDNCCVGITVMGNCVISVRSISASTSLMLSPNACGSIDMSWLALSDLCLLSKCLLERCQTNLATTTHNMDNRPPINPPPKYK